LRTTAARGGDIGEGSTTGSGGAISSAAGAGGVSCLGVLVRFRDFLLRRRVTLGMLSESPSKVKASGFSLESGLLLFPALFSSAIEKFRPFYFFFGILLENLKR
jgi:hypothetical protein